MSRALLLSLTAASAGAVLLATVAPSPSDEEERGLLFHAGAPVGHAPPWAAGASRRTDLGSARWRWPLTPRPPVLRRFQPPAGPYAAGHRGLDLSAGSGVAVLAVDAGLVTHSGTVAGRGTVTVLHPGGLRSSYEPLDPVVATGDPVTTGQVLGRLLAPTSSSHCGARGCLHLGARRGAAYIDPWPLLRGGRVVLLPLARSP